jgi:acyl-coenzyme A synthetase/AMP-(fatty) acid ligase
VYERDILQQEEGKGLNKGTPEHLAISDVSISMVVHYFDDLRTEEDYVNTYSKSHLSDSIVSSTNFSEEFAMIYLIHA